MSIEGVRRFRVSRDAVSETEEAIRAAGKNGFELLVLWSGALRGEIFEVLTTHVPKQTSYKLDAGLCVTIDGDELHKLNVWLFRAEQVIGVQIHSHPKLAYHSETDDAYPIATLKGSLSIVLPEFGAGGISASGVAAYRLTSEGWRELSEPLSHILEVGVRWR